MANLVTITVSAEVRIPKDAEIYYTPSGGPSGIRLPTGRVVLPRLSFELQETLPGDETDAEFTTLDWTEEGQRGLAVLDYIVQTVEPTA